MEDKIPQMNDQSPTPHIAAPSSNNQLPLVIGFSMLLLLVVGGAYYIGTRSTKPYVPPAVNSPTITPYPTNTSFINEPSPSITQSEVLTWKDVSFQVQKESMMSGSENVKVSLKIPSDWTLQTVEKPTSQNNMIKNCADYLITSPDKETILTISPICTGWSATYKAWPSDTVTVKDEGKVGNDNHSAALIRYSGSTTNNFIYTEGLKDQNQMLDAAMLYYESNFIPTKITITASNGAPDTKIADQIVSSIKSEL